MIKVTLSAGGMGDGATEADYNAYVAFVEEHLAQRVAFPVDVDAERYGIDLSEDVIRGAEEEERDAIREALQALWGEFCADPSLWADTATTVLAQSATTGEWFAGQRLPGGGWLLSPPLDKAHQDDVRRSIAADEAVTIDGAFVDQLPAGLTIVYSNGNPSLRRTP